MLPAREQRQPDLPRDAIRLTGTGASMPTRIYQITDSPVNLLTANDVDGNPLDLQIGKHYSGRYTAIGPQSILKVLEVADGTPVGVNSPALPVRVFEDCQILPVAGQSIFAWSERGGGQLVINDMG